MISPELEASLGDAAAYFVELAVVLIPLFLLASFLVGLAREYLPPERVEKALRERDEGSGNVYAAGMGAITPFCSCSTVPILAGLLQAGAPIGLSFSFLLASPLVNYIAVILLLGLFGVPITVLYIVTTFLAAVVAGVLIGRFDLQRHVKDVELNRTGQQTAVSDGGTCGGTQCGGAVTPPSHKVRVKAAGGDAWSFFVGMLPYLVLGIGIGAFLYGVVPQETIQRLIGPGNPFAVIIAAIAGAPLYVSLEAMLPIASSLADQGVPVGTVLAFVIGGAGVSIPNLIMLNKLFDRTLLAIYVVTVVSIGITVGLLFNAI
ncbi:permease [Natronobiforma cellulositropha]|uniref:permease n=1 Tax=Natronobiforma cellulositropha TaxID=1679076 RepID=UPI0021D5CF34|nr:permease [Natronobiforma cellulositropha]